MAETKQCVKRMPDWLLPGMLLVLGAGLHLAFLGSMPGGMHQDESFVALNGGHIIPF